MCARGSIGAGFVSLVFAIGGVFAFYALAQSACWNQQHIVGLTQHDIDLRCHLNAQLAICIGHIEHAVVIHSSVAVVAGGAAIVGIDVNGAWFDRTQAGLMAALGLAQNGEISRQTRRNARHVCFRDLRLNRHRIKLGKFDDGGCGLVGVYRLPLIGNYGHYRASHGRGNAGVAQIGLCGLHAHCVLGNGRFCCCQLGFGCCECMLCALVIGLTAGLMFKHVLLALEIVLRQCQC